VGQIQDNEPFRIIVGVDFSELAQEALQQAFDNALRRLDQDPEIHAVAVVDDGRGGVPIKGSRRHIGEMADTARSLLVDQVQTVRERVALTRPAISQIKTVVHVRVGDPVEQVCSLGVEIAASLIVVGTHGRRGVRRMVLGSVAERIARSAPCPVLVARQRDLVEMAKVQPPEPPPPEGIDDSREQELHRYTYTSVLDSNGPTNHLL
jgi:nucleotide-binding universal stress UspA family protein